MKDAIITALVAVIAFGAGVTFGTKHVLDMQRQAARQVTNTYTQKQEAE